MYIFRISWWKGLEILGDVGLIGVGDGEGGHAAVPHAQHHGPPVARGLHPFEVGLHPEIGDHSPVLAPERSDCLPAAVVVENILIGRIEYSHHVEYT